MQRPMSRCTCCPDKGAFSGGCIHGKEPGCCECKLNEAISTKYKEVVRGAAQQPRA